MLAALWHVDAAIGRALAQTRDPMIGQMRLTWWHDALTQLDVSTPRGQPELDDLRDQLAAFDPAVTPAQIAGLVEGWEALLDPLPLDDASLFLYAGARGGALFVLSAALVAPGLDAEAALRSGGAGWALVDFAARCTDGDTAARAMNMARKHFDEVVPRALPRPLRILAKLARGDAIAGRRMPRSPRKLIGSLW